MWRQSRKTNSPAPRKARRASQARAGSACGTPSCELLFCCCCCCNQNKASQAHLWQLVGFSPCFLLALSPPPESETKGKANEPTKETRKKSQARGQHLRAEHSGQSATQRGGAILAYYNRATPRCLAAHHLCSTALQSPGLSARRTFRSRAATGATAEPLYRLAQRNLPWMPWGKAERNEMPPLLLGSWLARR